MDLGQGESRVFKVTQVSVFFREEMGSDQVVVHKNECLPLWPHHSHPGAGPSPNGTNCQKLYYKFYTTTLILDDHVFSKR